jgi:transposase
MMGRSKSTDKVRRAMAMVHPNAAAIDVGATMHVAAVRADRTPEPVRSFGTFTKDLHRLVDWFAECGVDTVVMESTSVYWIPIFELLDARPAVLARLRDSRCHATVETIEKALTSTYRAEHLFALEQALALYDTYQEKASACDTRIEAVLKELSIRRGHEAGPLPSPRQRIRRQPNGMDFDVRAALYALLGKDLTQINGLGPYLALRLIAECGDDLSAWPSAKHFTSWLCLAPSNKISGGKVLSSRTRRSGSRAAALLRLAAATVGRTDTALGAFYRRLSARIGKAKAVTATARKIAVLFYNAVRYGMEYVDPGASFYETRYRARVIDNLHRRAKVFGFALHPLGPTPPAPVS